MSIREKLFDIFMYADIQLPYTSQTALSNKSIRVYLDVLSTLENNLGIKYNEAKQ